MHVDRTVSPRIDVVPRSVSSTTDTSWPAASSLVEPRRLHDPGGHEPPVAVEDVALVEGRLAVVAGRVGDVAERPAARGTPPTATRGPGTPPAGAPPAAGCAARRRARSWRSSPTRSVPVTGTSCSKRGPPISAPSSCVASTRPASSSSVPGSHGGTAERMSSSSVDRHRAAVAAGEPAADLVLDRDLGRRARQAQAPVPERLDQLERERTRAEDPRPPVLAARVVHGPRLEHRAAPGRRRARC